MGQRTRIAGVLLALVLFPLLSVPLYLLRNRIADAVDSDDSNGVFALGLVLGVAGPGLLAMAVSYRRVTTPAAVALGLAVGVISAAVLLAAFAIYCSATDCIV